MAMGKVRASKSKKTNGQKALNVLRFYDDIGDLVRQLDDALLVDSNKGLLLQLPGNGGVIALYAPEAMELYRKMQGHGLDILLLMANALYGNPIGKLSAPPA